MQTEPIKAKLCRYVEDERTSRRDPRTQAPFVYHTNPGAAWNDLDTIEIDPVEDPVFLYTGKSVILRGSTREFEFICNGHHIWLAEANLYFLEPFE